MRVASLVFLLLGPACGSHAPVIGKVERHHTDSAFEEANRLSLAMQEFDYGAPMNESRSALVQRAVDLLLDACWDGVLEACVQYEGYHTDSWMHGALHEAAVITAQSCVHGNAADCSFLLLHGRFASTMKLVPRAEALYFDACQIGNRGACTKVSAARVCLRAGVDTPECKQLRASAPGPEAVATLVRGFCEQGFARACAYVSSAHADPGFQLSVADAERYAKRACEQGDPWGCDRAETYASDIGDEEIIPALQALQPVGAAAMCKAGDWLNCRDIKDPGAERLTRLACEAGEAFACEFSTSSEAKEFACTSMGIECDHWLELVGDNTRKVRDILEHSCQWEHVDDCQRLVIGYHTHTYDEPVPGRAAALQSYVCKHDVHRCSPSTVSP